MGATAVANQNNVPATDEKYLKLADTKIGHGKNILEVKIPPRLEQLIQTGIPWWDKACGGDDSPGMTPSSVTLLTAVPGGGKTTLALQLADSITKNKHVALYNSGEESLFQVRKTVKRLGLPRGFICGEDHYLKDILAHSRKLIKENPDKQLFLFLDSLKTINDGFYADGAMNSKTPERVIKSLVEFCKETFTICTIIGHVTKDGKFEGKQKVKHDIDAHAHINFDLKPKSETYGMRVFSFSKNRFGPLNLAGTVLDLTKTGLVCMDVTADVDLDDAE